MWEQGTKTKDKVSTKHGTAAGAKERITSTTPTTASTTTTTT